MSNLSRVEQLLRNALGEDIYEVTPQSRVEVLLQQLNEYIEEMGGGSVDPEVITTWLAENIHDGAVVDSSLTIEGAAADSKKTGVEINQIKEDFTDMVNSAYVTDSASGAVAHFVDGADDVPMKSVKVNIDPVQSGSGDPSPSNVRTISGKTSVAVTRAGKNLVKPLAKTESGLTLTPQSDGGLLINGTYTGTTGWFVISTNVRLKAGQTYTLSLSGMEIAYGMNGYESSNPVTPNVDFVSNFRLRIENGQTFNNVLVYAQVEVGATATDFEAGVSDSYNISLTSAGTVYGGTLDAVSGVLTVDRAKIAVKNMAWSRTTSYAHPVFYVNQSGKANTYQKGACSFLRDISRADIAAAQNFANYAENGDFALCSNNAQIFARYDDITDVNTFKTQFADETFVYPIVNPTTYQLTPTEVRSLLGTNNIFADTGDSAVEYRADTTLYIQRLTEPDADMIADSNIVSGQYFMVGNSLFKATANIASGASVIVGTNAIRKSLSEALNEINA